MFTTEQIPGLDEESHASLSNCLAPPAAQSQFIFDAALSSAVAADAHHEAAALVPDGPLTSHMLDRINRYWRAANYLCIGQIYLFQSSIAA